jgi:hypothetical protein
MKLQSRRPQLPAAGSRLLFSFTDWRTPRYAQSDAYVPEKLSLGGARIVARGLKVTEVLLFEVQTPLGFAVRCTRGYWEFIVTHKHPVLRGRDQDVVQVLADPDEVRRSRKDPDLLLFYRGDSPRWLCAVARREDGTGFLITAYPTDAIKAGETIWTRSR